MASDRALPSALDDLLVLDLTDETGVYAAKLLADLGADVVRIEPPSGDPMRALHPFVTGPSGLVRSLPHLHYNANKRSLAVNIADAAGRAVFERLVASADIVVESFRPASARGVGITRERLASLNPRLIHVSVTGFGLDGPHRDYRWTDLIGQAMSGLMALTGFPDDPPARLPAAQGYHQASLTAAVGAMALVVRRDLGGGGGHVEVSMQDALAITTLQTSNLNHWTQLRVVPLRLGTGNPVREFRADGTQTSARHTIYRCLDGWALVAIRMVDWERAVDWLTELGDAGDLRSPQYEDRAARRLEHVYEILERCLARQPIERVYHTGQRHGLLSMPVREIGALFHDEQLHARGFLVEIEHPELGMVLTYAGAPYQLSETAWRLRRPAPELGEHTAEILTALGYAEVEVSALAERGAIACGGAAAGSVR